MAATRNGRRLTESANVFSCNAWDDVEDLWTVERKKEAEELINKQKSFPVPASQRADISSQQAGHWDKLYSQTGNRIYKDRAWLTLEFEELNAIMSKDFGDATIVEIGSGPGNTILPLCSLNQNPKLQMHALDFSQRAIDLLKEDPRYQNPNLHANVFDLTSLDPLPFPLQEATADVVTLIFVLSSLRPQDWAKAQANVLRILKPGGALLFRDFGRHDLCQLRFKKERWMADNFYIRGDKTQCYFFELEQVRQILIGNSPLDNPGTDKVLVEKNLSYDRRLLLNRKRQLKMFRVWLQGSFQLHTKP